MEQGHCHQYRTRVPLRGAVSLIDHFTTARKIVEGKNTRISRIVAIFRFSFSLCPLRILCICVCTCRTARFYIFISPRTSRLMCFTRTDVSVRTYIISRYTSCNLGLGPRAFCKTLVFAIDCLSRTLSASSSPLALISRAYFSLRTYNTWAPTRFFHREMYRFWPEISTK